MGEEEEEEEEEEQDRRKKLGLACQNTNQLESL